LHDLSDTAVHKLTTEILARPEFSAVNPKLPLWVEWLHKLSQWREKIQLLHDSAPVLYWMVAGIVVLVSIGLVADMIWNLRIAMSASASSVRDLSSGGSAPDLAREARTLAVAGNYLEAGHRLMIACFHALADHSIIELRPDRPNQWIRRAVRKSPLPSSLADDLDLLVMRTERRWFGGRENDPDIYTQWLSVFERLSAEVG
jgi:hypothetical protein